MSCGGDIERLAGRGRKSRVQCAHNERTVRRDTRAGHYNPICRRRPARSISSHAPSTKVREIARARCCQDKHMDARPRFAQRYRSFRATHTNHDVSVTVAPARGCDTLAACINITCLSATQLRSSLTYPPVRFDPSEIRRVAYMSSSQSLLC